MGSKSPNVLKFFFKKTSMITEIVQSLTIKNVYIHKKNKTTSLTLLNTNALNPAFTVLCLVFQKLIKKKDVKPINSQPKNNITKLPARTKIIILITKRFNMTNRRST